MVQHLLATATCPVAWLDSHRSRVSVLLIHCWGVDNSGVWPSRSRGRRQTRPLSQSNKAHGDYLWSGFISERLPLFSTCNDSNSRSATANRDLLPDRLIDLFDDESPDQTSYCTGVAHRLLADDDTHRGAGIRSGRSQQRRKYRVLYR